MNTKTLLAAGMLTLLAVAANAQVAISGYLANPPTSTDSPYEYVQLLATANINFSLTPMAVVVSDNGTATANGWVEGNSVTYAFNLTSGSVTAGSLFYVGGSGKAIDGSGSTSLAGQTWIRSINTGSTAGDGGTGSARTGGVLGNGGANVDGIAVFNTTSLTASMVPIDAVFFGSGTGSAVVSGGTQGYQLPVNDLYNGGKLQTTSSFLSDPGGQDYSRLVGTFDPNTGTWVVPRTSTLVTLTATSPLSAISSGITLVPEPCAGALGILGLVTASTLRRRRV